MKILDSFVDWRFVDFLVDLVCVWFLRWFSKFLDHSNFWIIVQISGSLFKFLDHCSNFWIIVQISGSLFKFLDHCSNFWIIVQISGSLFKFLDHFPDFWIIFQIFGSFFPISHSIPPHPQHPTQHKNFSYLNKSLTVI